MVALSSGEGRGKPRVLPSKPKNGWRGRSAVSPERKKAPRTVPKRGGRLPACTRSIADKRRDFQHQLSTRIIRENQVICVESLSVKNLLKNHCLAKQYQRRGMGRVHPPVGVQSPPGIGRTFVKIDRWYPSSKTCSSCQHVLEVLSLDDRFWTCPVMWHYP